MWGNFTMTVDRSKQQPSGMFDLNRPCGVLEQTQQGMDGVMR
jgi:hypothetical protein